jgi:hypothetical protein
VGSTTVTNVLLPRCVEQELLMNGKRNYAGGFWSEVKTMMMIDGVIGICDGGEK